MCLSNVDINHVKGYCNMRVKRGGADSRLTNVSIILKKGHLDGANRKAGVAPSL